MKDAFCSIVDLKLHASQRLNRLVECCNEGVSEVSVWIGSAGASNEITRWKQKGSDCIKNWLGCEDSNLEMTESESVALPFGYTPVRVKIRPAKIEEALPYVK